MLCSTHDDVYQPGTLQKVLFYVNVSLSGVILFVYLALLAVVRCRNNCEKSNFLPKILFFFFKFPHLISFLFEGKNFYKKIVPENSENTKKILPAEKCHLAIFFLFSELVEHAQNPPLPDGDHDNVGCRLHHQQFVQRAEHELAEFLAGAEIVQHRGNGLVAGIGICQQCPTVDCVQAKKNYIIGCFPKIAKKNYLKKCRRI